MRTAAATVLPVAAVLLRPARQCQPLVLQVR
jgi:hypothetical protein